MSLVAALRVQLGPKDPPLLTLGKTRDGVSVDVQSAFSSPILYSQRAMCTPKSTEGAGWVRTNKTRITPFCAFVPYRWRLAVGQLNHSVAYLNYRADTP
ncbi:MAG TPA: hypothetical protein DEV93_13080 [Chloroflexi bacterium]|nr:hypothetical protein [Chloroflexota bacterium]